jgi:hypothetical protein
MNDPRISAIRRHPLVGEHRLTFLLMCNSDSDIIAMLDADAVNSPGAAVTWAIEDQDFRLEQALNCRWGDDDDPQLLEYQAFQAERKQYA